MSTRDMFREEWENLIPHIEDTLRMESLDFGIEHVTDDCECEGKRCSGCKKSLCFKRFQKNRKGKFGLSHECRKCVSERYQRNKAQAYENSKRWRERHPEQSRALARRYKRNHATAVKAQTKAWKSANSEREKQYRQTHRKQLQENSARWIKNHPEYTRAYGRIKYLKRVARHTQAGGSYTVQEWEDLKVQYDYTCLRCGKREPDIKLTADHVIPVSKLGSSNIENIQPLCFSCNSRKNNKTIDYR